VSSPEFASDLSGNGALAAGNRPGDHDDHAPSLKHGGPG
jgi:hypothetical protein